MKPVPRILIIDDCLLKLETLGTCLAGDYDLQYAPSGPQGLERVRQQAPDLILLDSSMAGYWLLQALRADPATRDIPVICITAQGDSASEAQALAAGAIDCIQQPINPPVLRARVRLQLELRQHAMACFEAEQRLSESMELVDRALTEAAALQSHFLSIFDQSPIGIALLDAQGGQILDCNERYAAIVGRSVEQMRQLGSLNITHPDDQPLVATEIGRLQAGEISSFQLNARFLRPDHSSVWTHRTVALVQVDAPGHSLLLSMVEDITVQRETEQKLLDAKEAAEQASRAKSAFVANMSHEVRTPMNAVLGFLDILADSGLNVEQRTLLEKVQKASRALLRILNDILDFSKLDAGAVELELAPFTLDEVLRDATELMAPSASIKGLELALDVQPGLPQHYRGDALRLGQILLNLLGNAIKFTQQGSVRLAVRALGQAVDSQARLRFEVADTGIGMRPEQVDHLFQPFTQADDSTTRRFGGTGLGLTIVKRLVELMGGEIGVQSELGQGTTFWFTVSLAADVHAIAGLAGQQQPERGRPAGGRENMRQLEYLLKRAEPIRGARLLLVEDNLTNQEIALSLLGKMGLQVTVASHGREALDQLAAVRFDLVLMDLQMPVMDGFEATVAIRAIDWGRQLPIIAMTAAAFADDRRRVLEAGMNDFVSKPVDSQQLLDVLLRWLPHCPPQGLTAAAGLPVPTDQAATVVAPDAPQALLPAELEGFELGLALQRLGHDQTLLLRVLRQFLHDFQPDDWAGQFDTACRDGDRVSAQRLAHTLNGVAGSLGAVRVQAAASALEAMFEGAEGQPGIDPAGLRQRRDSCLQALCAAIAVLQAGLPAESDPAHGA